MAFAEPLSGDVQGMAPTRPIDPSSPGSAIKINKGKGRAPAVMSIQTPVEQPPEGQQPQSPPPEALDGEQQAKVPSPDEENAPGNPFVDNGGRTTASVNDPGEQDAPGNPFAQVSDSSKVDTSTMRAVIDTNLKDHLAKNPSGPEQLKPRDFLHDFLGGLGVGGQESVLGLALHGKPTSILPGQADMAMRIGKSIGQFAGDLPAMVLGGFLGGSVGGGEAAAIGSVAGPAGTVAGGITGATVGAGAGAFAVPPAIRKMFMDHYERGDITDRKELVARLMGTTWEAVKGGITGAATSLTGGLAAPVAGAMTAKAAELATMTTVGSALEGHLPTAQDFLDGAIVLGGLHSISHVAGSFKEGMTDAKLRNIYAETGETPAEIIEAAKKDVELKQQILAGNAQEPPQAGPKNMEHLPVEGEPKAEGEKPEIIGTKTELTPKSPEELGLGSPPPADSATRADPEKEVLSKIGISDKPEKPGWKQKFDDFYAKNIDYLDPIHSAIEEAKRGGAVISESAYDLGRLAAAHMDKTRSFLEFGTRDGETGAINGESLNNVLRDIPDGDINGYRAYAMAKRALELQGRGITPWEKFDKEGASKVVAAGKERFEETNQRRIDFSNRVLDWAQKKGLFSKDQIDAMKEANKNYIPFNRAFEENEVTGTVKSGSAIKKILGSDRDIVDPILQTYKNTEMIIKRATINEVRSTFTDNLKEGGLLGSGKEGEDLSNKYLNKVNATGLLGPNQIAIFKDGVREVYEGSPGVIDSLRRLDGDKTAMDTTVKILRGFSNATRLGVVSDPTFGFAHFFRSQIMSGIYSKTGMIPFIHPALSLSDFFNKSDTYQQWLYDGGATGSLFKLNETYLKNEEVIKANEPMGWREKAWNVIKTPLEASEAFIKLTDNLSRFTEYKRSLAQGVPNIEAAMRSRDVVPDYAKVGLQRSALRTGVAFIGAHINSLDRMGQEIQEDPKGFAMKMSALTGISAMLWAANKDDDAVNALPDWQKNTYWNFNISRFASDYKNGDQATILRLPKPWAPGILFGSGIEVALDQFSKDKPREVGHFVENLSKSVLPELMPNMLQPIMDQYSNKQAFSGRPLVPIYKEKMLPEMQYTPYTSETAKAIGKLIGYVPLVRDLGPSTDPLASPAVVENYIKAWTGTVGGWALKTSDWAMRGFQPDTKYSPWEDTPVLHRFVSHFPSFQDQNVQDFYENKDEADKHYNSYKAAAKAGDFAAAQAIAKAHPDFEVRLNFIAKGMSTARKTFSNIQDDPSIPKAEKQQLMNTLLFQIGSMAKAGNKMMSDFKRNIGDNKGVTNAGNDEGE